MPLPVSNTLRETKTSPPSLSAYINLHGLKIGKLIGEGSYSKVKLCTRRGHTEGSIFGEGNVACKVQI